MTAIFFLFLIFVPSIMYRKQRAYFFRNNKKRLCHIIFSILGQDTLTPIVFCLPIFFFIFCNSGV